MDQISRFIVWLCSKFSREQLEFINNELSDILQGRKDFPVNPKDAFREKHPNYRDFHVDQTPPLTEQGKKKNKTQTTGHCLRPIRPNTGVRLKPSRFKTGNPSHKPSNAQTVMRRINTCTTTTARNTPSCFAKSARGSSKLIIVLKEHSKPNTSVHIANRPCTDGRFFCTSLFTNAAMIIANIALTRLAS